MSAERILLMEDDDALRTGLRATLERLGYEVAEAPTVREAAQVQREVPLDVAVLDYQLSDGTALDLLPQLRGAVPRVPTLILTGHGSVELAVKALQFGADHFLTKPVELPALGAIVARLVEMGRDERKKLALAAKRRVRDGIDPFLGVSSAMRQLAQDAQRIAVAGATVLIQGETGVGKGVLANWIHDRGPRLHEPFVDLNCSVLSRDLVESELFGHRKGSFTGAVMDKPGLLEVAHRGTMFLDEIGDLDLHVQPKLLKALEEKRIRRVGDVSDRAVDVRLIAATHRNLARAVEDGTFRSDLFYRINTVPLEVPPLRERPEDIPLLADRLLNAISADLGRLSVTLSPACLDALCSYSWPGNVRELKNVLERAVLLTDRDTLRPDDLRFQDGPPRNGADALPPGLALEAVERRHITLVLQLCAGNVTEAARKLEVPRSSLYELLSKYAIEPAQYRN